MSELLKEKKKKQRKRKKTPAARFERASLSFTHDTYKTFPVSLKQNIWITFTLRW